MVIGFTQRSRNVSEGAVTPGGEIFQLSIMVTTLRTSERGYRVILHHQEHRSTAVVDSLFQANVDADVLFGVSSSPGDPLVWTTDLLPGQSAFQPITSAIINDFRMEPKECFIIRIYFSEFPGSREPQVTCNDDDGATNFFCEHTICIEDDDGNFVVDL